MQELICTVCPRGCRLKVDKDLNVTGNFCKRGISYGISEVTNPVRTVTSTVKINSKYLKRLPVKTDKPVPKDKIFDVMKIINQIEINTPIEINDIVLSNILNLGVNIVATRSIKE